MVVRYRATASEFSYWPLVLINIINENKGKDMIIYFTHLTKTEHPHGSTPHLMNGKLPGLGGGVKGLVATQLPKII